MYEYKLSIDDFTSLNITTRYIDNIKLRTCIIFKILIFQKKVKQTKVFQQTDQRPND
jgi:hypothetical protein